MRTIYFLVLASCVMAFVVTFTRNQLLGWLLLGVEIVGVVVVRSSFVGGRPWMQRLVRSATEPVLVPDGDID